MIKMICAFDVDEHILPEENISWTPPGNRNKGQQR